MSTDLPITARASSNRPILSNEFMRNYWETHSTNLALPSTRAGGKRIGFGRVGRTDKKV